MELLPLGPVLFIDTAGIDDEGALGALRVEKTRQVFDRTDLGVLVTEAGNWGTFEDQMLDELETRKIPVMVAFNKSDLSSPDPMLLAALSERKIHTVQVSALSGEGIPSLREALLD